MQYYGQTYYTYSYFGNPYFQEPSTNGANMSVTYSGLYNSSKFDVPSFFVGGYWSLTPYNPPLAPVFKISSYNPFSGSTAGINVDPSVTFTGSPSGSVYFTLFDSGNHAVGASLNFNSSTNTETLTPNSPLTYSANYTAHIMATGTNGTFVDFTWPFFTAASAVPVTHHHVVFQVPGKLLEPTINLVVNTNNISKFKIYY